MQHHFVVCAGNGPIVAIQKKWEGGLDGPVSADQQTWVNLERVQELVEMIYRQLKRLAINSQLEIEVEGGALALDYHYQLYALDYEEQPAANLTRGTIICGRQSKQTRFVTPVVTQRLKSDFQTSIKVILSY